LSKTDETVRDGLEILLSGYGYQIEHYASAEDFLSAAESSKAGSLLVDINLGDISGVELARQLAAGGYRFPIIFMTGSSDEIIRRQAMEIGCVAFLHKPLPEDQLIESIVEAMTSNSDFD
jgi:FixJ family two-component response regulator